MVEARIASLHDVPASTKGCAVAAATAVARPHNDAVTRLDDLMPDFEYGNRHAIVVEAPAASVATAVDTYRVDSSVLVRLLFRLRGLRAPAGTLQSLLTGARFTVLAEVPGREVVLGVAGRFWAWDEAAAMIRVPDARAFVEFNEPGTAKAAVNLLCEPVGAMATRVSTETRVKCVDAAARWRFAPYWALIKPFSAYIRRDMLRGIRRHALE